MNRIASRNVPSPRRRAIAVVGLVAVGLLTGLGQGTALAVEPPTGHRAALPAGFSSGVGLPGGVDGPLSGVPMLPQDNNDWQ